MTFLLPPGIKGLNILNMLQVPKEKQFTSEKANFLKNLKTRKSFAKSFHGNIYEPRRVFRLYSNYDGAFCKNAWR